MTKSKKKRPHLAKISGDDRITRFTFENTIRTAGLIREFLPQEIVQCLDLANLRLIRDQHIDKHLQEKRDDLNLECPALPGGTALIRILVEHKSCHDPQLWFQLMDSILMTWRRTKFAIVIPIVLHTGKDPFKFISPQYMLRSYAEALLNTLAYLPIFPIDLARTSMERINESANLDPESKVILGILKLVQLHQIDIGSIRLIIRKNFPDEPNETQRELLSAAANYISSRVPAAREVIETLRNDMSLAHPIHPQSMFAEDLRKAKARAEARGEARGEAKMKVKIIQALLENGMQWEQITNITHTTPKEFELFRTMVLGHL